MESNQINPRLDIIGDIAQLLLLILGIAYLIDPSDTIIVGLTIAGTLTVGVYSQRAINLEERSRTPLSDAIIVLSGVSVVFYFIAQTDAADIIPQILVLSPYTSLLFVILGILFKFLLVDEVVKEFSIRMSNISLRFFRAFFNSPLFLVRFPLLVISLTSALMTQMDIIAFPLGTNLSVFSISLYFLITSKYVSPILKYTVIRILLGVIYTLGVFYLMLSLTDLTFPSQVIYWISLLIWVLSLTRLKNVLKKLYLALFLFKEWIKRFFSENWISLIRWILIIFALISLFVVEDRKTTIGSLNIKPNFLVGGSLGMLAFSDKILSTIRKISHEVYKFFTVTIPSIIKWVNSLIQRFGYWLKTNILLASRYLAFGLAILAFFLLEDVKIASFPMNLFVPLLLLIFAFYTQIIALGNALINSVNWLYRDVLLAFLMGMYGFFKNVYNYVRQNPMLTSRYLAGTLSLFSFFLAPRKASFNIWLSLILLAYAFHPQVLSILHATYLTLVSLLRSLKEILVRLYHWIRFNQFRAFRYLCIFLAIPAYFMLRQPLNSISSLSLLAVGFSPTIQRIGLFAYNLLRAFKQMFLEDSSKITGYGGLLIAFLNQIIDTSLVIYLFLVFTSSILLLHGWEGKIARFYDSLTYFVWNLTLFAQNLWVSLFRFIVKNISYVSLCNLLALILIFLSIFYPLFLPLPNHIVFRISFILLAGIIYSLPTSKRREKLLAILRYIGNLPIRISKSVFSMIQLFIMIIWENIILVFTWILFFFLTWLGLSLIFSFLGSPFSIFFTTELTFESKLVEIIVAFTFIGTAVVAQGWTYNRRERLKIGRNNK